MLDACATGIVRVKQIWDSHVLAGWSTDGDRSTNDDATPIRGTPVIDATGHASGRGFFPDDADVGVASGPNVEYSYPKVFGVEPIDVAGPSDGHLRSRSGSRDTTVPSHEPPCHTTSSSSAARLRPKP
ncbi:MAG: hypothetical protein ACJAXA_000125 [Candidatus Aldehydirespiratoraceae bacterium]|jgi:hypothetical protein